MNKPETERRTKYFEEVVLPYEGDDCLIWPFYRNPKGYGMLTVRGKREIASREVCRRTHGEPLPEQIDSAHSCGNGHLGCVNPKHIRWATRKENVADKLIHGKSNRGERCGSAKLKESDVAQIIAMKGKATQAKIGEMFGVHATTISKIWLGKRWRYDDATT